MRNVNILCKVDGIERIFEIAGSCWVADLQAHLQHFAPEGVITDIQLLPPPEPPLQPWDDIDTHGRQSAPPK